MSLSFGLNVSKKKKSTSLSSRPSKRRVNVFDNDDNEEIPLSVEQQNVDITTFVGLSSSPSEPHKHPKPHGNTSTRLPPLKPKYASASSLAPSLSALHSSIKHSKDAETLDPTVYAYDSVYESLHSTKDDPKSSSGAQSGPKYITALKATAHTRELDRLRARDKMLQREREAEDPDLQNTEKFVTGAYAAQQEELRQLEAEEKKKCEEEDERKRMNGGAGMIGWYKNVLERDERRHEEVVKAVEEAAKKGDLQEGETAEEAPREKTEAELAAELRMKGRNVILNDEGQVVDKRQLLSAGLNITAKPKVTAKEELSSSASAARSDAHGYHRQPDRARMEMLQRQSKMLKAQIEQTAKRAADEELARNEELAKASKSKKTEQDISSARERYLARKQQREKEKANSKSGE